VSTYRKPLPYRKAQTYRGAETALPIAPPTAAGMLAAPYTQNAARAAVLRLAVASAAAHASLLRARYAAEDDVSGWLAVPLTQPSPNADTLRAPFGDTKTPTGTDLTLHHNQQAPRGSTRALPWRDTATHVAIAADLPWAMQTPRGDSLAAPWGAFAAESAELSPLWRALAARGALIALPWGRGNERSRDIGLPYPVEPGPTDPGGSPITVPILPVYAMIPTLSAVVLPERTPLDLLTCSLSTDASQAGWRFSAALPRAALALVNPSTASEPPQIEITVNGYVWIVAVVDYNDGRKFGANNATISGYSRSIILAAPYAPLRTRVQTADRTAAQIADEELGDGLSLPETGWTLIWDAVDWLVPGGTWSYADQSPIEAIAALARAIGARVETDRALLQLAVKPTYPISPWGWDAAEPYAILPAAIVSSGDGRWQGGSNAGGIYISGAESGYSAHVTIAGTGGVPPLPMVVDRVLRIADPARERGRHELAAAGKIKLETITMPLFPSPADPGLIPIGELVDVQETATMTWRGMVQGVRIDATRNGPAFSVRQTLAVERQFR
jgi:hypothetical protein